MRSRRNVFVLTIIALAIAPLRLGLAQAPATALDPVAVAEKIQGEVAALRGLPFKQPVHARSQTPEEFREYLDKRMKETVPDEMSAHYGKIIRKLGLYRGPEIQNAPALMKSVASSQAAAYYDPHTSSFYVLASNMPELMMGTLFSHELYHGLQDQYFDLQRYMHMNERGPNDNDLVLARQAVVEGEATYVMSMWMVQRMTGRAPTREVMAPVVRMQSEMNMEMIAAAFKQPQFAELVGPDIQAAIAAAKEIPPYILEMMMGAYLKGLGFVSEVHGKGWPEVEKLYTEYPPESTEQILHADKWFAREAPLKMAWRSLSGERAIKGWDVLAENTIGEFLWRSIFREHDLESEAEALAAGWDGDRYAVLRRKGGEDLLLLLNTAWDTEADATEFAKAYEHLLKVKYENEPQQTRIVQSGKDVFVVEGGTERELGSLMKVAKKAKRRRA